ncbi:hypothetical protein TNCV_4845901 [Trichonephila clavipes]|uniref:Uncharacterized protein n=1 Tax=Trichonephila clavipes TaxID=2585209 RepID=A0A8X6WJH1_TRICX|nr:hypothetical protein TNCV_4845901 [Trichonephila clavipes]
MQAIRYFTRQDVDRLETLQSVEDVTMVVADFDLVYITLGSNTMAIGDEPCNLMVKRRGRHHSWPTHSPIFNSMSTGRL